MSETEKGVVAENDPVWAAARAAADVIVALPGTSADLPPTEMFFRKIVASGPEGFRMGSRDGGPDEEPIHRVVIEEDFFLGTFVVTQEQWAAVWPEIEGLYGQKGTWKHPSAANPSFHEGSGLLPVEYVTWYDAMAFCDRLTRHGQVIGGNCPTEGDWRFCLPTESEWEYACRGGRERLGRDTEYWNGDGEAALREVGWFGGNSGGCTHHVTEAIITGSVEDHPLGLFGIHGNVWEWCHDEADYCAYRGRVNGDGDRAVEDRSQVLRILACGGPTVLQPPLLPNDRIRVIRGGAWFDSAERCHATCRLWHGPDTRRKYVGFRVCLVRDLSNEPNEPGSAAHSNPLSPAAEPIEGDTGGSARPTSARPVSGEEHQRAGREGSRE